MGIDAIDPSRRGLKAIRMSETHAQLQMVKLGSKYELLSATNSSMFVLRFKPENLAAHLEGDDAARFREDYTASPQFPAWDSETRLWPNFGIKAAIAGRRARGR